MSEDPGNEIKPEIEDNEVLDKEDAFHIALQESTNTST